MGESGVRKPLLTGSLDAPTLKTNQNGDSNSKRKRYRRCKSAPLAHHVQGQVIGKDGSVDGLVSRSISIFERIHPSVRKVAIFLFFYMAMGVICFYLVRHQIEGEKTNPILDSVYFCIVTLTSVGYGDLVPNSAAAKLLACVFVFSGMALIALVLSKGADYLVEKQELLLVKALHMHQKVGQTEIVKEIETHKVRCKCAMTFILLMVLMAVGTIFLVRVEKLDIVDAFYCVCSTITALGYGDKSFSTEGGRIFAIFWILTSILCVAQFFLYVAELYSENRQKELVKLVLNKRMTNVDLEVADLDDDGVVSAAEFVLYKLKEMGKINQEDISVVMEEFEYLDVDQSGTLSACDLKLAQSP